MYFPAEIRDIIISHLLEDWSEYAGDGWSHLTKGINKDLENIRLVDKAWSASATAALFHILADSLLLNTHVVPGAEAPQSLNHISKIANSHYAKDVRRVVLHVRDCAEGKHALGLLDIPAQLDKLTKKLLRSLRKFDALSSLCVTNEDLGIDFSFESLGRILSKCPGITELVLGLVPIIRPSLFGYGIPEGCPEKMIAATKRLRRLKVGTKHGPDGYVGNLTSSVFLPILFALLTANLEQLSLWSDCGLWVLQRGSAENLRSLKMLYLNNIGIDEPVIVQLLENCQDDLRHISLDAVGLTTGSWNKVFLSLCELNGLNFLRLSYCAYAALRSEDYKIGPHFLTTKVGDDPPDIRSQKSCDYEALRHLRRRFESRSRIMTLDTSSALFPRRGDSDCS